MGLWEALARKRTLWPEVTTVKNPGARKGSRPSKCGINFYRNVEAKV